jgi:hypothetical protein
MAEARQRPQNRAELLAVIAISWNACVALIDALTPEQWTSATDENVVTEVFRSGSPQYATLQMTTAGWAAGGIDGADVVIHASKAGQSLRRVQNNRDVTHARIVSILTELPEEELQRSFSAFGAVDADRPVLEEMMDYLVGRYDDLYASITAIVDAEGT